MDEWTQEVLCDDFYGTTWNKVPLPTVPAEEITAWYKHINRSVSYNNGQYETDRDVYKRQVQTNMNRRNRDSMLKTAERLDGMGVAEMRIIRTTEAPRWVQNAGDACLTFEEYYDAVSYTHLSVRTAISQR